LTSRHPSPDSRTRRASRLTAIGILTACVVGGLGLGSASVAVAAGAFSVKVSTDRPGFLSQEEIPGAWKAAVTASNLELPPDVEFPATPPAFFNGERGTVYVYEAPLVEHFVLNFWRCAWISEELRAQGSRLSIDSTMFTAVNDQYRLTLPGTARAEFDLYIANAPKRAQAMGRSAQDAVALIYEADCETLTGQVEN
jgi:hypothetical protein